MSRAASLRLSPDHSTQALPTTAPVKQAKPKLIKPIEVRLANASCFDFLRTVKSESVDLVLIDPPYEISRSTGFASCGEKGVARLKVNMDFGTWDHKFDGLADVIAECYRVLAPGGTFICFYDLFKISPLKDMMESARFKQIRFLEWIKTNPVPINSKVNYLTNAREIALLGVKGSKPTFNGTYDKGIYEYPICHEKGRFHPTQKPLALIQALVEKHSERGDTVLDCFSGSGTTAHASMRSLRHFVGCELDKEYHAKSLARLSAAVEDSTAVKIKGK